MINLIPTEEKSRMITNFHLRLAILFILAASFVMFFACSALLPAYILSSVKNSAINKKLELQKKEPLPQPGEQSLATIKDLNSKLSLVENIENNKFLISEKIINEILSKKNSQIKITQILYQIDPIQGKKITLLGTAPSRELLLSFRQALEDDPNFKNVILPISNFVKISNIQFNLSLSPL